MHVAVSSSFVVLHHHISCFVTVLLFRLGFLGLVLTCFRMDLLFVLYSLRLIAFLIVCHFFCFRALP